MSTPYLDRRRRIDELDRDIVADSALMNRTMYHTLTRVREFDELAGYLEWSFESCAQWLAWRCDIGMSAARERVRVAHALDVLPQISEALALGTLSYTKARALTRVATRENEAELLAFAMKTDAVRVEERTRQVRNVRPESTAQAAKRNAQRALRVFRDVARGTVTITIELPFEHGELVCRAIDKAAQARLDDGPELTKESWLARQADALVDLARSYLSGDGEGRSGSADHYQVVVHVDATALKGGEGLSDLPIESVRRLTCDGSVVEVGDDPDGEPLSVGSKRRTVPAAVKRALWARDRGCAVPGCTHTRFVDAHHVRHWALGGETSLANLVLLCTAHHARVHEGALQIVKDVQGRWRFRGRDGRAIPPHGYRPEGVVGDDADPSAEGCVQVSLALTVLEPRPREEAA